MPTHCTVRNTKLKMYISEDILIYTAMTVEAAIQAWFESEAMPNSICLRLINYNSGVAQVIAYKYSNYYGAVIYFGYGIDGIKLLKHTNGAWS